MYPTPQEQAVIDAAEKIMIDTMARYDPSHDKHHVHRVRKTALTIARSLPVPPDLLVVELASLLHDVLDKKYVTPAEAEDPYAYFLPLFKSIASTHSLDLIQDGRAKLISKIVSNVSWSNEKKLRKEGLWSDWHEACLELHCVQDADRLDAIGAFGIMRCAAYSAITNRTLYVPVEDTAYPASAVHHFHDKLLLIHDHLKTDLGRSLGEKRHKRLLDFLESLQEEYDAVIS
ncbi:hypothetical protein Agabi119p4_5898 [Agaricus bisporus var. burnettii]|uniref:HD/PDEase domain-containing protein n=1 Tax=Agaricus bisporus var. burnettii TaxID=192524 RepID=A0A8H7KG46_AGABI|nr:hypothetical protein Agabi119p4_5898 [Agaricus bisporus var. burnettii]